MRLSVVYGRELDGKPVTFGTSGYTLNDTFVLYDRATRSLWYPIDRHTLAAVAGPLQGRAIRLLDRPRIVPLGQWLDRYPDAQIMLPPTNDAVFHP